MFELGLSGWHGSYNTFVIEGEKVAEARPLTIAAVDVRLTTDLMVIRGEAAYAWIDVPDSLASTFGEQQSGLHLDVVAPILTFRALGYDNATLNVGARYEHVDYNGGQLDTTGADAGDYVNKVVAMVSFRPGGDTVFRLNYSYLWTVDLFDNEPARGAALQGGFATYF